MSSKTLSSLAAFLLVGTTTIAGAEPSSIYTPLCAKKCKLLTQNRETGATVRRCPGIRGYKLLLEDDDERMSVTIVSPSGEKHPLDVWNVVTRSFSKVGRKAEWRVPSNKNGKPNALIFRVDATVQDNCAFRPKPIRDSGPSRSPVPVEADHRFRSKPIAERLIR